MMGSQPSGPSSPLPLGEGQGEGSGLGPPPQPLNPAALAQDVVQRLRSAISQRGRAVLSVSGGRSPVPLFQALARQTLDWRQVVVTLVDERCVPCTHEASNAHLVREHLLHGPAASAQFVPLVPQATEPLPPPAQLAAAADAALLALGPADVLLLGMGTDGHTASIFPGARNLSELLDEACPHACLAVELDELPAQAPYARVTQTLAHMLRSRHLMLPVSGADKLVTLRQAQAGRSDALPISHFLHQDRAPLALWISP